MSEFPLLSSIVFLPLVGAILLYLFPGFGPRQDPESRAVRAFSMVVTLITFVLSLLLWGGFNPQNTGYQFVENKIWLPSFGITYHVGLDGISLFLVLLTTFLMPIVVLASNSVEKKVRGYLASMLVLQSAMLGTLVALDMFLFYIFWELMLAPMYFIIGVWGGKRRIYAALKFVLYTVFGSVLMLVGIFYLVWAYYQQHGVVTFGLESLARFNGLSVQEEVWLFAAFALAFCIKVPVFPFHTWLPDAHVEAPTGGSVVLAGVMLKMGLYGLIRLAYPLFPRAAELFTPYLAGLAVIGVVYGAMVAWAQKDIKKLVAYSSVSHLGYCVLGFVAFNTVSAAGSIYQMLNHGISTGALFLLVGVLYDRRHTREISEYGGLAARVPIFAFLFLVFTLSSIALPLTNGFIGEFLILAGSFQELPGFTIVAVAGVVLGAVYMLTLYMKTMYGEIDEAKNGALTDVSMRELVTFAPLLALVFIMGIYPKPFLNALEPTIKNYIRVVEERRQMLKSSAPMRTRQVAEDQAADEKISSVSDKSKTALDALIVKRSKV
ncbi:MAG: NADH-quinone oxidoreductase subunit M [Oligoflexia bacterium]|nr:NADH-quinone oxidoreductase subunit M [Oligoflexia bacterium]